MKIPLHPDEILRDTALREMTLTEFAKRLSVSRVAPGGSPETWMCVQVAYDLSHAQKKKRPKVEPIEPRQVANRLR